MDTRPVPRPRGRTSDEFNGSINSPTGLPTNVKPGEVEGAKRVTLVKCLSGYGFSVQGGVDTPHPLVYVDRILPDSSADETDLIRVGDIILEADEQSLIGVLHVDAVRIVNRAFDKSRLSLIIKRPETNGILSPTAQASHPSSRPALPLPPLPITREQTRAPNSPLPPRPQHFQPQSLAPTPAQRGGASPLPPRRSTERLSPIDLLPPPPNMPLPPPPVPHHGHAQPPLPPKGSPLPPPPSPGGAAAMAAPPPAFFGRSPSSSSATLVANVSKDDATAVLLANGPVPGSFIIRPSASFGGQLVITLVTADGSIEHIGPLGVREDQVPALVEHHRRTTDTLPILLTQCLSDVAARRYGA
eukprot:m.73441 g.73441  ORF g.73441 m.73441 type:complete len:358 (+) comp14459_c0_seq1:110-1183(+)